MSPQLLRGVTGLTVELFSLLSCSLPTIAHTDALRQGVLCFFTKGVEGLYTRKEDNMLCQC